MARPNILLIMCDQMRHDSLACSGNPVIQTPELDRLAASGVNFQNSYTPDPICVPARASLTTGMYPHRCTGRKTNSGQIKPELPVLGHLLQDLGYRTYAMGKLHYVPYQPPGEPRLVHGLQEVELAESGRVLNQYDPKGELQGVEDYHDYLHSVGWGGYTRGHGLGNNDVYAAASPIPEEYYVDTWVADRAIYHMREHLDQRSDQPFFMWASFPKPHSAYDPPHPWDQMYDPRDMPEPIGSLELLQERKDYGKVANHFKSMWHLLSPEAKRVIRAHYYGLISLQDKQVGRMLDFLEENNIRDDTIVIYTADHGDLLGDFGLYFKQSFLNGSVRVPLMISYPRRIASGAVSPELAGLQDILPTLLSLVDADTVPQDMDGIDLTPALDGAALDRQYYVSQCKEDPEQQYMVASQRWKYVYHQYGGVEQLYDLQADPNELTNLADSSDTAVQEQRQAMRAYLIEWCREYEDASMLDNNDLKSAPPPASMQVKAPSGFGRRWY